MPGTVLDARGFGRNKIKVLPSWSQERQTNKYTNEELTHKENKPDHEIRLRGSFRTVNTGRLTDMGSLGGVSQEEGAARTKALERTELELVISKEQKKGPGWLEHSESDRKRQERREEVRGGPVTLGREGRGASGFTPGAT